MGEYSQNYEHELIAMVIGHIVVVGVIVIIGSVCVWCL